MRAVGDSRTPLIFLVIACVINIILDYVFILVFHTGVEGAAYATVIAQLLSGLACIPVILARLPMLRIKTSDISWNVRDMLEHIRVALPVGFQMSIIAIGSVTVTFALNGLGTTAVAAFTSAQKIDMLATFPLSSFGAAMTTYAAQNFGAGKYARIKSGVVQGMIMAQVFSVFMAVVFLFAGKSFAAIFLGSEREAIDLSYTFLVINGSCYPLLACLFIFRQTIQGLGNSLVPTLAGIAELLMRTFAAIFLSGLLGFAGICWASPLAWLGALIPLSAALVLTFKRLSYKSHRVA
jgi:Na+-driven multidrug efflux pump